MKYFSIIMFVILTTGTNAVILTKKQISQICEFKYMAPSSIDPHGGQEIYCFINNKEKYIIGVYKDCQPGKKVFKKQNTNKFDTCEQDNKSFDLLVYQSLVFNECQNNKIQVFGTVKCSNKNTYVTDAYYYKNTSTKCKSIIANLKKSYRCSTLV